MRTLDNEPDGHESKEYRKGLREGSGSKYQGGNRVNGRQGIQGVSNSGDLRRPRKN